MRRGDSRRQAGSVLPWLLFFLLLAALVGSFIKSGWDQDDLEKAESRAHEVESERDELAWKLENATEELSQTELRRAELARRVVKLERDNARLEEELAACRNSLGPARRDRDRYFEDSLRTSRRLEDALSELAALAPLKARLVELEETDAVRRKRLQSAVAMAKDLLERLRRARADLSRDEE